MTTIILFRGNHDSTVGGFTFKGNGVLNFISSSDWDKIYTKYKGYFDKRIVSDKNPNGQYIISEQENKATDIKKEVGKLETVDTSEEAIDNKVIKEMEKIAPELASLHKESVKAKRSRKKRAKK